MNLVILSGGVGKDVECRFLPAGTAVANISLATNSVYYDKEKQKHEKTEWHNIVLYGKMAENAAKYITKGSKIAVEGELQHQSWDGPDGKKHYKTEVKANSVEYIMLKERNGDGMNQEQPETPDLPGKGVDKRLQPQTAYDMPF